MAAMLTMAPYIRSACYPGLLIPNARILQEGPLSCDDTIINPGISFLIILNNHSQINFMLSPTAFLIWAKSGCNFLNLGSHFDPLF